MNLVSYKQLPDLITFTFNPIQIIRIENRDGKAVIVCLTGSTGNITASYFFCVNTYALVLSDVSAFIPMVELTTLGDGLPIAYNPFQTPVFGPHENGNHCFLIQNGENNVTYVQETYGDVLLLFEAV